MSIVDKVKEMLGQNADKAKQAVDKAGDMVDQRTGGKYADKVDMAQDRARQYLDQNDAKRGRQGQTPQQPQGRGQQPPEQAGPAS
ncbi:antitoxin [Actinomadura hibisca]|uniref:antitoxin n=1 Tax=Actinomadura hibisca TaxID=68565 RepID=UPI00082B2F1F|nr:antitoxin [Actinomadura hibisca]